MKAPGTELEIAVLEQELQLAPGIETDQVHLIAVAHWRRMRLGSVETSQYVEETAKRLAAAGHRQEATHLTRSFRSLSDETRALELLNRNGSRYCREYRNALACFKNHREDIRRARVPDRAPGGVRLIHAFPRVSAPLVGFSSQAPSATPAYPRW
jgi:hypothetical protein